MLGEIASSLSIFDWVSKKLPFLNRFNKSVETIASRFLNLFEYHGVHRNQIPGFFQHGLTALDVKDDETLLPKLTEEILDDVCTLFAIRREWLDGADEQVYECHDFYKSPHEIQKFIKSLKVITPDGDLDGVLIVPEDTDWPNQSLIVLEETIGYINEKEINRFYLCNNWLFSYWKSRADLTACIAIAWKNKVYIKGRKMPSKELNQLATGNVFLNCSSSGVYSLGSYMWYPEDMTYDPDLYLEDIRSEENNFGLKSAIERWLILEKEGLMDADLNHINIQNKFISKLDELNHN